MTITVDRFLSGVKRRITKPANDQRLTDADMLEMADDCMRDMVVPLILSTNQNYFVVAEDFPTVDGQGEYEIPARAMGRALRDVKALRDPDTNSVRDLSLIALEDEHLYAQSGHPSGFYFKGDLFVLVPKPVGDLYTIRMFYNQQPSRLTATTNGAKVVTVTGDTIVCESAGGNMANGTLVDIVKGSGASRVLVKDLPIVSLSGTTFIFPTLSVPAIVSAGDYISVAQTTPLLQIPDEGQPYFEAAVAERCLQAISDFEGAGIISGKLPEYARNFAKVISPRVEGEGTKIVNRKGLLRGKGWSYWRVRGGYYT